MVELLDLDFMEKLKWEKIFLIIKKQPDALASDCCYVVVICILSFDKLTYLLNYTSSIKPKFLMDLGLRTVLNKVIW